MHVLVMADWFLPGQAGGALRTLSRLVPAEAREHELEVLTRDRDLGSSRTFTAEERDRGAASVGVPVHYVDTRSVRGMGALVRACLDRRYAAVYLNSLWSPIFSLLPIALLSLPRRRRPMVLLAPRGELGAGALAVKSTKKRVVGAVLRRALRRDWITWHASSADEAAAVHQWMGRPVQVIVCTDQAGPPAVVPSAGSDSSAVLRVVCVTRIVPVKDIARLLEVVTLSEADLDVRLYGPIEDEAYWNSCAPLIERLPANVRFKYGGVLTPDGVTEVYQDADVVLFPTRGENFGHVIAEALAVGCPVVTTPTTYWTEYIDAGAGLTFTENEVAAQFLDSLACKLPAQRAKDRAICLSIYTDWYQRSVLAPSLFTRLED